MYRCLFSNIMRPCIHLFSVDSFPVPCPNLGKLNKILIRHDNHGIGPGWYLKKVSKAKPSQI